MVQLRGRRAHKCITHARAHTNEREGSWLKGILEKEQIALPEDVYNTLCGGDGYYGLNGKWVEKVTICLSRGELPEGMECEDIINTVRKAISKER